MTNKPPLRLLFDIETNGFLENVSKMHCISMVNLDTGEIREYRPHEIDEGIEYLKTATYLTGHNVIKYDLPVIEKLTGVDLWDYAEINDTLVDGRLIFSNIKEADFARRNYPKRLIGRHSLEAWGHRLGTYKGDYGKDTDWQTFDEDMLKYCTDDVLANLELWKLLDSKGYPKSSLMLETDAARVLAKQERNGFKLDLNKARSLYGVLAEERHKIDTELAREYSGWWVSEGLREPKRTIRAKIGSRAMPTIKGAPYTKIKWVDFNPTSRQHITKIFLEAGWDPKEFTPSGQPKIDETVLDGLDFPAAPLFAKQFLLQKRIGQVAEGNQGWLNVERDGYIYGSINPNGAVTGRATHSHPNIGQVPGANKDKAGNILWGEAGSWGAECRQCFTVPEGWVLFGSDASGLELRCLGHFMARYDGGAYIKVILEGDIHTANQKAAKLGTRAEAKTFIYAFLYGAGDELLGEAIGYTESEYLRWKRLGRHEPVIKRLKAQNERILKHNQEVKAGEKDDKLKPVIKITKDKICHILKGDQVRKQFLKGLPALAHLIDAVKQAAKRGFLVGLDGRKVYVRSPHSALNTLLQSAGALICKAWIVEIEKLALADGLTHGWSGDFAYCAWVHDEMQIACRTPEIANKFGEYSKQAIKIIEERFKFRCPLDVDYDIGQTWLETH